MAESNLQRAKRIKAGFDREFLLTCIFVTIAVLVLSVSALWLVFQ
jgi:hypothetical protein